MCTTKSGSLTLLHSRTENSKTKNNLQKKSWKIRMRSKLDLYILLDPVTLNTLDNQQSHD